MITKVLISCKYMIVKEFRTKCYCLRLAHWTVYEYEKYVVSVFCVNVCVQVKFSYTGKFLSQSLKYFSHYILKGFKLY